MFTRSRHQHNSHDRARVRVISIIPAGVYIHGRIVNPNDLLEALYSRFRKFFQ